MDPELDAILLCFTFILICAANDIKEKKPRRKRRWGIRPLNQKRLKLDFKCLYDEMKAGDDEQYIKYIRMDKETFTNLLNMIKHKIQKKPMRHTIKPEYRLALTLHYLAHGTSMQEGSWEFYNGESTTSMIVKETCQAIWDILSPIYMKQLSNEDWLAKADGFEKQWNLPNCVGALDGKHIHIQAPNKSGTAFFNYKKRFSLVLMAVCDADYMFTMVDIGAFGSISDGGVFKDSCFGRGLEDGTLKFPPDSYLPDTYNMFPYFMAADAAFPLKSYIMRPFPGKFLPERERIFNYRLSRGRRCIENAFGILAGRWRIFRNDIIADVSTIEKITAAAVCLHNFLLVTQKEKSTTHYIPHTYKDTALPNGKVQNGDWRNEVKNSWKRVGRAGSNNRSNSVTNNRNILAEYFMTVGAVPWQQAIALEGSYPLSDSETSDIDSPSSETE